jgi:hypothetical protein
MTLMLLALLGAYCGSTKAGVFTNETGGFEITLPDDWQEIPPEAVGAMQRKLSAAAPGLAKLVYKYGYQRVSDAGWFVYPYVVVQVTDQGPVAEEQVARAAGQPGSLDKGIEEATKKSGGIIKDAGFAETYYDYQRHMLHTLTQAQVAGLGDIRGISALFLTSRGTLTFHFYCRKDDFDNFTNAFESAIHSVKLSRELAYSPPPARPGSNNFILIGALVGACVGGIYSLFKQHFAGKRAGIPSDRT